MDSLPSPAACAPPVDLPQQVDPPQQTERTWKAPAAAWQLAGGIALALVTAGLHALPWLVESCFWCGWLAIAFGLTLATRRGWIASWWMTWLWSTLALGLAFYWSPAAMAYTLDSGWGLGFAVALPFLVWDGLRLAAGYWLAARLTREVTVIWLPAGLIAMALEWALPSVFPWRLGLPQLALPWLVQAADLWGGGWTTLIAFAHAGLLLSVGWLIWKRPVRLVGGQAARSGASLRPAPVASSRQPLPSYAAICGGVLAFNALYGTWSWWTWEQRSEQAPRLQVGLIQVDPSYTWSTDRLRELTADIAPAAELVCWPESSGGNYELALDDLSDADEVFARSREPERGLQPWTTPSCELLLGGKSYQGERDDPERLHVTAMLIDPQQRITDRYHKRFLMPFGEYVPFEDSLPGMAELFAMAEHVQPGAAAHTIASRTGAQLGTMLCYEDMVPQAAYEATRAGASVLISLANGSAFASHHTLRQHRLLAQLRAVECRRYLLRCAATGETCSISATGRIVDRLPVQEDAALLTSAALLQGQTLFVRYPWLGSSLDLLGLFAVVLHLRSLKR